MGRVRTKTVKKASKVIIEKYYPRLTNDFQTNKKLVEEIAIIPTKRLRNRIAGFTTHLMRRIETGPVRGISIKLQEEQRERRDNYVPEVSALEVEGGKVQVDQETQDMLKHLGFENFPTIVVQVQASNYVAREQRGPVVPGAAPVGGAERPPRRPRAAAPAAAQNE